MTTYSTRTALSSANSTLVNDNTANEISPGDIRNSILNAFDSAASGTQVGTVYASAQTGFTPPAALGGKWRVVKDTDFQSGLTMTSEDYVIFANCQISGASTFTTCDNVVFTECFVEATTTLTDCTKVAFFSCEEDTAGRIVSNDYAGLRFVDHRPRPNASSPWDDVPAFPEEYRTGWWFDPRAVNDTQVRAFEAQHHGWGIYNQCKPINPLGHGVIIPSSFYRQCPILVRGGSGEALWQCRYSQEVTATERDGTLQDGRNMNSFVNGQFYYDGHWIKGTGWSIADQAATKTAGTASTLVSEAIKAQVFTSVWIEFDATITAGTLTPKFSSTADGSTVINTFTAVTTSDSHRLNSGQVTFDGDVYLVFDASSDFAGSISNVKVLSIDRSTDGHCNFAVGTPVALPNALVPGFQRNSYARPQTQIGDDVDVITDVYFPTNMTEWKKVFGNGVPWTILEFIYNNAVIGGNLTNGNIGPIGNISLNQFSGEVRWTIAAKSGNDIDGSDLSIGGNNGIAYGDPVEENRWYRIRVNYALSNTEDGYLHWWLNDELLLSVTGVNIGNYHTTDAAKPNVGRITFANYQANIINSGVLSDPTIVRAPGLDYHEQYFGNLAVKVTPRS